MLIFPGKGVGQFIINKSTRNEIEKELGDGIRSMKSSYSDHGPQGENYDRLEYKELGLTFSFRLYTDTISSISINKACDCLTYDGIKAGRTLRVKIYEKFGQTPLESDVCKVDYKTIGIGFTFANCRTGSESDTLTSINIFQPRK